MTGDPEDADPRAPDHAADALRYLLINLEAPPPADLFRPIMWRYWRSAAEGGTCGGRHWRSTEAWRFGTVYLPHGEDAVFDHAVACAWAYTISGDLVLLDQVRMPGIEATAETLLGAMSRRHDLDATFIPKKQAAEPFRMDASRAGVHLSLLDVDADRLARALPAAELVAAARVWLPDRNWKADWVAECATFPANQSAGRVETLAAAVRVVNTQWVPPPRQLAKPRAERDDPFTGLGHGYSEVNLLNVPL